MTRWVVGSDLGALVGLGLAPTSTGGNCTALVYRWADGAELLVTGEEGRAPTPADPLWFVALYDTAGEQVGPTWFAPPADAVAIARRAIRYRPTYAERFISLLEVADCEARRERVLAEEHEALQELVRRYGVIP